MTTTETLGVKAAKAYLTRTGEPDATSAKLPAIAPVSNVRTPWQRGRKVTSKLKPITGPTLNPTIS
jgi:hypothetical protein